MGLFFFFESTQANLAMYFLITTIVFTMGPEKIMPSLNKARDVPIVETQMGKIRGNKLQSRDLQRDIYAYYGIPYAKPPVGELRFARPEPPELPWEGVRDCSRNANICVQQGIKTEWLTMHRGYEDCLTLNVYVPKTEENDKTKLPVMVWIHGGGFTSGDATDLMYGPRYLLDRDVILVTVQYRLGALGFLDLGHQEIGGNQAMWDQRLALKWVQDNIDAFGGDPKLVTLFGESAGSFSVMFHLAAPDSQGLFSGAIAQSGTINGAFHGLNRRGGPMKNYHMEFAHAVGCQVSGSDFGKVADCLRAVDVETLLANQHIFDQCNTVTEMHIPFPSPWKPVFDGGRTAEAFFDETPREMIEAGKMVKGVSLMIGTTLNEGLLQTGPLLSTPEKMEELQSDWDKCTLANGFGKRTEDGNDLTPIEKDVVNKVQDLYFRGKKGKQVTIPGDFDSLERFKTETGFAFPVEKTVRSLLSGGDKNNIYYYRFDHSGSFSMSDVFSERPLGVITTFIKKIFGFHSTKSLGVAHADDLLYLFSQGFTALPDEKDHDVSRKMVDLWVNFATYRNPTPKYKGSYIGRHLQHLKRPWEASKLTSDGTVLNQVSISSSDDFQMPDSEKDLKEWKERMEFWVDADRKVNGP